MGQALTDADIAKLDSGHPLTDADIDKHDELLSKGFSLGDTLKQYWDKINPVTQSQGLAQAGEHPIQAVNSYGDQNQALFDKAKESFKSGDYAEGVRHTLSYFLNGIPGVGAALDAAGNKARSGDTSGAVADTAALATQLIGAKIAPSILDAATEPGLVSKVTAPIKAVAKNPAILKGAGAAVGATVGHATGIPGAGYVGAYAGREAGSALGDMLNPKEAEIDPLLDEVAKGIGGHDYASLPQNLKTLAQAAYEKLKTTEASASSYTPPPANPGQGPIDIGPKLEKGPMIQDLLQQELAARRGMSDVQPANAPPAPESPGLRGPVRPPMASPIDTRAVAITNASVDDLLNELRGRIEATSPGSTHAPGQLGGEAPNVYEEGKGAAKPEGVRILKPEDLSPNSPLLKNPAARAIALKLAQESQQ